MAKRNIFIASSSELKRERMELVDLMQDMNNEQNENGIKLKPVIWETMDSSMRAGRKEDEYLEKLKECQTCIVLFWRTLGEYTLEELDVAIEEKSAGRLPKHVKVLFKEPCEGITEELSEFKMNFKVKYPTVSQFTFNDTKSLKEIAAAILIQESFNK